VVAAGALQRGERPVNWLWILAGVFVILGSLLAMAEASLTRMTRIRALSLEEEGRRNAALLVRLETDPPRYLNSIYLTVMIVQNGSAILVAILAESTFGGLGITIASLVFTLLYFVLVEAMSKTFAILHSDRVALALSPLVFFLGRVLAWPTRALIGLANILLPGKGIKAGPFVSEGDIRSMAEVGSEEGSIEEEEKELIHSIFEFGDTIVREVMVPRPDIICIEDDKSLRDVQALVLTHGTSRIPVYNADEDLDDVIGIIFAKDVLKALHQGKQDLPLAEIVRPARYVPESKKVGILLREMQREKFHMALVTDEYGSVTGLVALEDLLEELVGEITDEYDREEPEIQKVEEGCYRVSGKASIDDVNEELDAELPDEEWDTIAGLVLDLFGRIPEEHEEVTFEGLTFRTEEVIGRRISTVLITRVPSDDDDPVPAEVGETEA
jgi:CBS domain containing-hemolysin-like protein